MSLVVLILMAFFLDLMLGDPPCYPHPVRLIGKLIQFYEHHSRQIIPSALVAGFATLCLVLSSVLFVTFLLLTLSTFLSSYVEATVAILILYTCIAIKDLRYEAWMVYEVMKTGDIVAARNQVGRIVGRDTTGLSEKGVIKATVETVAENLSDGVIAPLFWAIFCGVIAQELGYNAIHFSVYGAVIYKAINTMDSMIGYKNDKYIYFGRSAAYLDDYVNFLPARITGFIIVLLAFVSGTNGRLSFKILMQDRLKHTSPNAGHPEAAIAGMLGVELCGPSVYFGKIVEKPRIGQPLREIRNSDIILTNKVALWSVFLFLFFFLTPCYFTPILAS